MNDIEPFWDDEGYTSRAFYGGNRGAVLDRDRHRCRQCLSRWTPSVHHIDPRGERTPYNNGRNNKMDMLITLCSACHPLLHQCQEEYIKKSGLTRDELANILIQ